MSFSTMAARINYLGGDSLGRIKKNKLWSFQRALKDSYQTRKIKTPNKSVWPCLINSNNLKSDYDRKIVSVEFASGLKAGETFECLDDGTHWLIYLPELTETAYLRSEIIRCRYTLDIDGITYWIYFQGPTETDIRWFQKSGTNMNELNLSGTIYIKKDKHTQEFFHRFKTFQIEGHTWEAQVVDAITVPGIIEIEVQEFYDNTPAELPKIIKEGCHEIVGRESVEQDEEYGYTIRDSYRNPDYTWSVSGNPRVEVIDIYDDGQSCKVKVHPGAIRGFQIVYGDDHSGYHMDVTIARKCKGINGPQTVYPYDIVTYTTPVAGQFHVESQLVKIVDTTETSCTIEVETGKKGNFVLFFNPDNENTTIELPVTIGSL